MKKSRAIFAVLAFASAAMAQPDTSPPLPPGGGLPSAEQIFTFMDGDQDGFIARDEAQGPMVRHFEAVDADQDARISLAELKSAMAAMRPPEAPEGEPEAPGA
jgi:hypothetical protein